MARDIVSDEARSYLDGMGRVLRPEEQTILLDSRLGSITSYVDPVLKRSRRHYVGFVTKLHAIGLAVVCHDPAEFVGICFVHKNGKKGIRLILDARKTTRLFASPPSVSLLTTEGICSADVVGADSAREARATRMAF